MAPEGVYGRFGSSEAVFGSGVYGRYDPQVSGLQVRVCVRLLADDHGAFI
jgi:hypothetical protein